MPALNLPPSNKTAGGLVLALRSPTFGQLHSDEGARGNPVPRTVLGLGFDHRAHGRFSHPANVLPEPDGRQQLTVNP